MSQFSYSNCGAQLLNHYCDPCDEGELGGVSSIFFYKDGAFSGVPVTADFTNGVQNGLVVVIPETRGTFDGGTPNYGKGFGRRTTTYDSSDYKLTYTDRNYKQNNTFYNSAQSQTEWNVGWCSETLIHLSGTPVTIYGKDPHTEEVKNKIYWEVECTWNSKNKPLIYPTPTGVFECFVLIP